LILSLVIGLAFIYAGFRFFHKRIKDIDEISELKKNNIAVAILNGSIILSLEIMVKNAIEPAITTFTLTLRNPDSSLTSFLQTAAIMLIQIIVAGVLAFLAIYIALNLYTFLTRDLDEI